LKKWQVLWTRKKLTRLSTFLKRCGNFFCPAEKLGKFKLNNRDNRKSTFDNN
jgi:hypothetical protein